MRRVTVGFRVLIMVTGIVGCLHLASMNSSKPLLLIAEVEGTSMEPTLQPGAHLLCVRAPWHEGDIVVAWAGEDGLVVKRVAGRRGDTAYLQGDNRASSQDYVVNSRDIRTVMLCRLTLPRGLAASAAAADDR